MGRWIITGNYTSDAMKGMIAHPSDRGAAVAALMKAAGGKLLDYYLTTGDSDFIMVVEGKSITDMLPALIVAGAAGGATNLKSVQAMTSDEFLSAQKAAGALMKKYKAPN